jgi:GlpG protein
MRQIATLADEEAARKFADYLLTLKIDSNVAHDPAGFAVWVCDEDKVERARQELAEFTRDPAHPRYGEAVGRAQALRKQEAREEKAYARRQRHIEKEMALASTVGKQPVTLLLLAASVAVTLLTNFGKLTDSGLLEKLYIAPYTIQGEWVYWYPQLGLDAVLHGQVWRLVTPIFIHLNPLHLIFNMLMLLALGGSVESAAGKWKYLLLVLVLAVSSNVAEYYMNFSLAQQPWFSLQPSPFFGGMSGVLYGLFGFAWVKSRYEPEYGLHMSRQNVTIMLVWLVVCLVGVVGPVANVAHIAGMLAGMLLGYAPRLWRRVR